MFGIVVICSFFVIVGGCERLHYGAALGSLTSVVISTVVDGFSNPNEADDYVAEEDFDEFDADDDDDGNGGSKALTKKLEELKREALSRFDRMAELFEKIHKTYDKEGYGTPTYLKTQKTLSEELMTIRLTAPTMVLCRRAIIHAQYT